MDELLLKSCFKTSSDTRGSNFTYLFSSTNSLSAILFINIYFFFNSENLCKDNRKHYIIIHRSFKTLFWTWIFVFWYIHTVPIIRSKTARCSYFKRALAIDFVHNKSLFWNPLSLSLFFFFFFFLTPWYTFGVLLVGFFWLVGWVFFKNSYRKKKCWFAYFTP